MMESSPRVLILNSKVDALSRLFRVLSERGCRVATYTSPWGACDYAAAEQPDAILTSLGFRGCEGLEIVRLLRKASRRSRIIAFAPDGGGIRPGDAADAGADAFLRTTPLQEEILLRLPVLLGEPIAAGAR
jgi:PleD family two-component response regulator